MNTNHNKPNVAGGGSSAHPFHAPTPPFAIAPPPNSHHPHPYPLPSPLVAYPSHQSPAAPPTPLPNQLYPPYNPNNPNNPSINPQNFMSPYESHNQQLQQHQMQMKRENESTLNLNPPSNKNPAHALANSNANPNTIINGPPISATPPVPPHNNNINMSNAGNNNINNNNNNSSSQNAELEFHENITAQQMAQIQAQIRRYKALAKKYTDLKTALQPVPLVPQPLWQPQHLVSGIGSTPAQDGMLGLNVCDIGPCSKFISKSPSVSISQMLQLREKCFKNSLSNETDNETLKLLSLQRALRSNIIGQNIPLIKASLQPYPLPIPLRSQPPTSSGTPPQTEMRLFPPDQFYRSKKNNKRELKVMEKDLKKKKSEKDEVKSVMSRRQHQAFTRSVMVYREEFMRFHKGKYLECMKAARAVKQWIESVESRKEKQDIRAESRRMQALKENNMEAYIALVQETKNTRLKYLLAQTDDYIATIRNMIRDQRQDETAAVLSGMGQEMTTSLEGGEKASQLSRQYYHDTHRHSEVVSQPRILQGGDLKEYQLAGLEWLVSLYNNNLNGILADEMGLGKTIQTLALLAYVLEFKHNHGPFLIVVPLSTLSNWVNEANKWTPTMTKVVYRGPPAVRRQLYKDEVEPGLFNTLFTTYEYIMKDRAQLKKIDWQYIIVDEGHRMKNAQSKFAQTLGSLYQSKHRLLLTGTPLQNNLPELWSLLNFLLPSIFNSVDTFDQWFNQPFASFRSSAASTTASTEDDGDLSQLTQEERLLIVNRLHEVLRPFMLRRIKDQVLDQLPDKTETVIRCEMSGWQKKLYRLIHQKTLATVKDAVGNVSNVYGSGLNNVIMQLRKVCNHPYLFLANWPVDDDLVRAAGKFELLDRMLPKLKAAGHRVLMFSQMTQCMTILERFFDLKGLPYLRLDGSTSADEREKRMWMFNDPDSPFFIFLLSTRAGGLGLNLATADTVILFDSDWNPMMDAQAQDRAHRIGQKNEVRVFRLVTTSAMEEKILARATDKRNLTGLVVEAGKFNRTESVDGGDRKAMMEALLKEYSEGIDIEEDGESDEAAVPDDEQINDMMATNDVEFALYQRLDKERDQRRRAEYQASPNYSIPLLPIKKEIRKSPEEDLNNSVPEDEIPASVEKETLPPLPSRLTSVAEVPLWARNQEAWLSKHHQLFAMSEQVEKNNLQVGLGGIYTVEAEGDDEEDSNLDTASVDGVSGGGGRGMSNLSAGGVNWNSNSRKRKVTTGVMYDDGLTETQFMELVEKTEKEAEEQKVSRKKSLGRNKKAIPVEPPIEIPLPDISDDPNALTPETTKLVLKVISDLLKVKTEEGFRVYELFVEKPDKRIFSDYYAIIEKPIALKTIQSNLKKGGVYRVIGDVLTDFELMCANAKTYNEDSSPVYALSVALRDDYIKRLNDSLEHQKTPKKKRGGGKKKIAVEGGEGRDGGDGEEDEEHSGPRKKRARVSTGGGGGGGAGKKRGKKSNSSTPSTVTEKEENEQQNIKLVVNKNQPMKAKVDHEEEEEEQQEEDRDQEHDNDNDENENEQDDEEEQEDEAQDQDQEGDEGEGDGEEEEKTTLRITFPASYLRKVSH